MPTPRNPDEPNGVPMAPDAVTELRLKQLEATAAGARATERAVDHLQIAIGRLEKALTEVRTEQRDNNGHARDALKALEDKLDTSLSRLHQRLDAIVSAEDREAGAKEERARLAGLGAKVIAAIVGLNSMVVAILMLILK